MLLTVAGGGRSLRVWVVEGNLAVEIEMVCDLAGYCLIEQRALCFFPCIYLFYNFQVLKSSNKKLNTETAP